jgi:formylglycine-generating enzyme
MEANSQYREIRRLGSASQLVEDSAGSLLVLREEGPSPRAAVKWDKLSGGSEGLPPLLSQDAGGLIRPYIRGGALSDEVQGRFFHEQEVRRLADGLLVILGKIHSSGLVHGAIKLGNVIMDSESRRIWLVDPSPAPEGGAKEDLSSLAGLVAALMLPYAPASSRDLDMLPLRWQCWLDLLIGGKAESAEQAREWLQDPSCIEVQSSLAALLRSEAEELLGNEAARKESIEAQAEKQLARVDTAFQERFFAAGREVSAVWRKLLDSSELGSDDFRVRVEKMLSSWSSSPIGIKGIWRLPMFVELEAAASILEGTAAPGLRERYRQAHLQSHSAQAGRRRLDAMSKALRAAERVCEVELQLSGEQNAGWWHRSKGESKKRILQLRALLAIAIDGREAILPTLLPQMRGCLDSEEAVRSTKDAIRALGEELEAAESHWLSLLPEIEERKPEADPPFPLSTFTISLGGLSCGLRLLSSEAMGGSAIWMASHPVTQALYSAVLGDHPSRFTGDRNPVEMVSWMDCIRFCNALSESEGLAPAYLVDGETFDVRLSDPLVGYRLPTVQEWTAAAGAMRSHPYSGSDSADEVAWCRRNSGDETHPVGSKKPNCWGLYDMSGNVEEWCWDEVTVRGVSHRSRRGGSWYGDDGHVRISSRTSGEPQSRADNIGFRIVRSVD